jgi:hypothetical protein
LKAALRKLEDLYPQARFPPITTAVAAASPSASADATPASRLASRRYVRPTGSIPMSTGAVSYAYMKGLVAGREMEIGMAFTADEDKTDLSGWLYNSTAEKPADLGYWVGYRIVKSYYRHADDKRQALRDIFGMTKPKEFLARSGWRPGIVLDWLVRQRKPGTADEALNVVRQGDRASVFSYSSRH